MNRHHFPAAFRAKKFKAERWARNHPRESPTLFNALPCSRCGSNPRYLDLDICEPCVSAISGYQDEHFGKGGES
jgi:hypothetical protein